MKEVERFDRQGAFRFDTARVRQPTRQWNIGKFEAPNTKPDGPGALLHSTVAMADRRARRPRQYRPPRTNMEHSPHASANARDLSSEKPGGNTIRRRPFRMMVFRLSRARIVMTDREHIFALELDEHRSERSIRDER